MVVGRGDEVELTDGEGEGQGAFDTGGVVGGAVDTVDGDFGGLGNGDGERAGGG